MGEEQAADNGSNNGKRRRRRRKRRRSGGGSGNDSANASAAPNNWGDDLLVTSDEGNQVQETVSKSKRKRRHAVEFAGPQITLPASGRNPHRKRAARSRRAAPGSAAGRKRRLSRVEIDALTEWLTRMPNVLVSNLYRGLGGQPNRVASHDRMLQLAVRAIAQGSRLGTLLRNLHERDRKALAALLQCGGIAHAREFTRELILSFGGHDREWNRTMLVLAEKGVVVSSSEQDGQFFYIIPEPLIDGLLGELASELALPTFSHDEVRVMDERPFCPPLDFTITTLATYIDQLAPRLTQRQEIYRHDQEAMDSFFAQLWEPNSELFSFHLNFLMMHGMVELRGEYLSLNREVMEEWLQLEAEDQRDLIFRALDKRFEMAEWVLWAIHATTDSESQWVAERPLVDLYRRWKRGEDWRDRMHRGAITNVRTSERESFSFSPLVRCGILEMGQWGQEKFYRLSPRGRNLLEPAEDDGFRQFYLTPSFEVMAPAGLAPILLFRIGELAELIGCDRANTYRITEPTIERALERGWRRDDVLQFLRDNSQIGLPENVEQTLKGWIGHRGDVEFHDLCMMTVHRSQIRRLEGIKRLKPYLLHRFAPGMYAVDRDRRHDLAGVLEECGFSPGKETRAYPGAPEQVEARQSLHRLVAEAREEAVDPVNRGSTLAPPEALLPVPGTKVANLMEPTDDLPPQVSPDEVQGV
ncbi:MAG: hypothetical protein HN348_02860, partial [Proteobacteria bacterium]|nr:hypothetical protein [Pseudomonadota bacterium]